MAHTSIFLFVLFVTVAVQGSNDGFIVLRGAPEHSLTSMPEQYVADLISHVSGLPPVNQQTNRNNFPQTDLFSTPAANFLVAIDSVTQELLNKANTKFLNLENEQTVEIVKAAYPEDSLSTLTTVLTGKDHTAHGIVGHSWKASRDVSVQGYSKGGNCQVPKLADYIAVASEGAAKIVAVSGSKPMAAALGVHADIMQNHPEYNSEVLYFSRQRGLVELYSDETFESFTVIGQSASKRQMTLKTLEGHILATELNAIAAIPSRLNRMMKGESVSEPDFIAVGITSIKALTLKYGSDSPQVLDALRLLDSELSGLFAKLNEMYNGNIVTEIIGLQSSTEEHTFYTQRKQQKRLLEEDPTGDDTDSTTYTQADVQAFQTKFWVAIVLIIAAILATLTLVKMDKLENSLIYRSTDGPRPIADVS
eukprot:CAMPEP_0117037662 /NCGR_PEP_ID=MMETSP0472-20121206/26555_1 /TAXON_ID=693140 ORGANISM="Tiarina fusus, Strain LIS" /NCGR_SAMPLE_ID=MMETSP0472 /ASSEMBLY_ACC=CAM_ASM_000603 /LENGTH=420 /DNA_ID=CAMNT_0004747681 /DNA_START=51 /DNA_END=1313 /DNA_ORIENTATION=+